MTINLYSFVSISPDDFFKIKKIDILDQLLRGYDFSLPLSNKLFIDVHVGDSGSSISLLSSAVNRPFLCQQRFVDAFNADSQDTNCISSMVRHSSYVTFMHSRLRHFLYGSSNTATLPDWIGATALNISLDRDVLFDEVPPRFNRDNAFYNIYSKTLSRSISLLINQDCINDIIFMKSDVHDLPRAPNANSSLNQISLEILGQRSDMLLNLSSI